MTATVKASGEPRTTTSIVARPSSGRVFWNPTKMRAERERFAYTGK